MNHEEKAQVVQEVRGQFADAPFIVLTDFKGSTVEQMNKLRRAFEEKGIGFRVVKNTLAKRAIAETDHAPLSPHFKGNIGVVFSGEDPANAAKVLKDQIKDNDHLVVRAGYFEGDVLDDSGVMAIADLPSREQLLVMLLRTLQESPRRVLRVLQAPARDLLYLLQNLAKKLEEQEG
jgi:large subunit ribosomal protein L10